MKYEELANICREDTETFKVAFTLFAGIGAEAITNATMDDFKGELQNMENKYEILALAKSMTGASLDTIFAVIQRELPQVKGDGEDIPFLNHYGDEDGVCPCCGAEIEYEGDNEIDDDGTIVSWECPNCGATGKAGYNGVFAGHFQVEDANGNPIPDRD